MISWWVGLFRVGFVGGFVMILLFNFRSAFAYATTESLIVTWLIGAAYFSIIHILLAGFDRLRSVIRT